MPQGDYSRGLDWRLMDSFIHNVTEATPAQLDEHIKDCREMKNAAHVKPYKRILWQRMEELLLTWKTGGQRNATS